MAEKSFPDQELEYLLNLLERYSEKLRTRSEFWYRLRSRAYIVLFLCASVLLICGTWISLVLTPHAPLLGDKTIDLIVVLIAIFVDTFAFFTYVRLRHRVRQEEYDIFQLRRVVEELVRRASQLEDHGDIDFTYRIAFDLRLAETEAALKRSAIPAQRFKYL